MAQGPTGSSRPPRLQERAPPPPEGVKKPPQVQPWNCGSSVRSVVTRRDTELLIRKLNPSSVWSMRLPRTSRLICASRALLSWPCRRLVRLTWLVCLVDTQPVKPSPVTAWPFWTGLQFLREITYFKACGSTNMTFSMGCWPVWHSTGRSAREMPNCPTPHWKSLQFHWSLGGKRSNTVGNRTSAWIGVPMVLTTYWVVN